MLSLAVALLLAAPQPRTQVDKDLFKFHYLRAERYYREGDLRAAVASFREAEAVKATPEVAFNLAQCHEALHEQGAATVYYRLYLERAPASDDAKEVAAKVDRLFSDAARSGKVFLEIRGPGGVEVSLGDQKLPELPQGLFLPKGAYTVEAHLPKGLVAKAVTLEKEPVTVTFDEAELRAAEPTPAAKPKADLGESLRDDDEVRVAPAPVLVPAAAPASAPPAAVAVTEAPAEPSGGGSRRALHRASLVGLGVGAAALLAGTAFGLASSGDRARAQGPERTQLTAGELQAAADSANRNGAVANVAWIAGGVTAAAAGLVFAFTLPGEDGR